MHCNERTITMKVIFAGGGTGGHIIPAISIADYVKSHNNDFEALFIGTEKGLEHKLVPNAGYNIEYIEIEGFSRKNMLKNIPIAAKLIQAQAKCRKIIKNFKPDCVVCTGGYVSGPVAMAAKAMGVPSLIHEQNVYPGLTVKGSQKYVDYVAVSFEETVNLLQNKEKCVVTGNPIRSELLTSDKEESRNKLNITKPFVLVFGGSLGADAINNCVLGILERVINEGKIQLLFGTGDRNYQKTMDEISRLGIKLNDDVKVVPYINDMAAYMSAADIVVSRAGAITVSEIAALAKPSILIPSPNVVRNHQEQNAREFEKNGAASLIVEKNLTPDLLYSKLMEMIDNPEILSSMSDNLRKISKTDALEQIYNLILKMTIGK